MQRFAAFDPPEYAAWKRVDEDVRAFQATIAADAERARVVDALDEAGRMALYRGLVRNRLADVALKRLVRQGVISKAWLGTGEEAATIGPVHALRATKRLLRESPHRSLSEQLHAEALSFGNCSAHDDFAEGINAFVAKRPPRFNG